MPEPLPPIPLRPTDGHKGTFGTVVVVGGTAVRPGAAAGAPPRMIGGPAFAAIAALRSGAGLAKLLVPEPLAAAAMEIAPSATALPLPVREDDHDLDAPRCAPVLDEALRAAQGAVAGPGLGTSPGAETVVLRLISQETVPLVLDADALNVLAGLKDVGPDLRSPAVLTPHPGEFARLAGALGIGGDAAADPEAAAAALAQRLGSVVILKGARTVVADGIRSWSHERPNPALATAGTGDVLAGLLGGLIAQHARITPVGPRGMELFDAARLAVAIHADAAEAWSREAGATGGMLAADLLERLPAAVESRRAPNARSGPRPG